MNDIVCPHCKKMFKIDESAYVAILEQVKGVEFERELMARVKMEVELAEEKTKNLSQTEFAKKERKFMEIESAKEKEIAELKSKANALVAELKAKLESAETEKKLAVSETASRLEKERDELAGELRVKSGEIELVESKWKDKFATEMKGKDEMIAYYKDMKVRLSTKMVGEDLEQHCQISFERDLRPMLPATVFFGKDNDVVKGGDDKGTKGDFVYREVDEHGAELLSVMFEMKNENDETATKHKNEDFLVKLDGDRKKKKCEYAVLVSLLEGESELYNVGIVDVSHKFEKMYVIRPQFFVPMITLLRNANMKALSDRRALVAMQEQNIDITNFERDLENWKAGFAKNVVNAAKKYKDAIDSIDKSIEQLQKTKEALMTSEKHLLAANNKAEDISVKKLTRKNPTMRERFEELGKE